MTTKKSKPKKLTMAEVRINEINDRCTAIVHLLGDQITAHSHQIKALEEAICPRVAARLTALERQDQMSIKREEDNYIKLYKAAQQVIAARVRGPTLSLSLALDRLHSLL